VVRLFLWFVFRDEVASGEKLSFIPLVWQRKGCVADRETDCRTVGGYELCFRTRVRVSPDLV
jgi:hypothetical protein